MDRNLTTANNIDFFVDVRKQLEKFSKTFQVVIHFHRSHLQLKTLVNSFGALKYQLVIKMDYYFLVSFDTNINFGFSKICQNP